MAYGHLGCLFNNTPSKIEPLGSDIGVEDMRIGDEEIPGC